MARARLNALTTPQGSHGLLQEERTAVQDVLEETSLLVPGYEVDPELSRDA